MITWYPRPAGAHRREQRILAAGGRSMTVSIVLAVVGFAALLPGFLAVAAQVHGRGEWLAAIGAALTVAGCVGFAVLASTDATAVATSHVSNTDAMSDLLGKLDVSPTIIAITPVAVAGLFAGPFLVTLGARRARLATRWLPRLVLASMLLQPISAALSGPSTVNRLVAAVCQLALVVATIRLSRDTLPHSEPATGGAPA